MTAVYARLLQAWNERDSAAFAGLFAADGLLIGFDGSQVVGADIAGHLAADAPTSRYVAKVRGTRPVGVDGVLVHAIAGMVPAGGFDLDPALNAVHTLLVVDGTVVLFQSTPARYRGRPDLAASHNAELTPALLDGETLAS
ncbi:SgcJ/EcaC family oxidoreductase [Actinoplanes sp. NPDC051494]|uniref:SgcJ/EcaC family oxidoreductase n=1 Tax=Actinoplanes sp. NPDC051494 TaxID=3363907 RepID=UPI0037BC1771